MKTKKLLKSIVSVAMVALLAVGLTIPMTVSAATTPLKLVDVEDEKIFPLGTLPHDPPKDAVYGYCTGSGNFDVVERDNAMSGVTSRMLRYYKKGRGTDPIGVVDVFKNSTDWSKYKNGYVVFYADNTESSNDISLTLNFIHRSEDGEPFWSLFNWEADTSSSDYDYKMFDGTQLKKLDAGSNGFTSIPMGFQGYLAFNITPLIKTGFDASTMTMDRLGFYGLEDISMGNCLYIDNVFICNDLKVSGGKLMADGVDVNTLFDIKEEATTTKATTTKPKTTKATTTAKPQTTTKGNTTKATTTESVATSSVTEATDGSTLPSETVATDATDATGEPTDVTEATDATDATEPSDTGTTTTTAPEETPTDTEPNGLPTGAIIGIVIAAIVVLGGGGVLLYLFVIKPKSADKE